MGRHSSDSGLEQSSKKNKDRRDHRRRRHRSSSSSDSSNSHSRRNRERSFRHGKSRSERDSGGRVRRRRSRSASSSRSGSRSYIREYVSTKPRSSSSSSSSTTTSSEATRRTKKRNTESNLFQTKTVEPTTTNNSRVEIAPEVLLEINQDSFKSKNFTTKSKDTIVIDLQRQTIKVAQVEEKKPEVENLFHDNLFQTEEVRLIKWLKEHYSYRHKALQVGSMKN